MEWVRRGRVAWIFGDHFVPDEIIGSQIQVFDPEKLRKLAMADFEPGFADKVQPGDLFVAGRNYGYGRTHGPVIIAMKTLGIEAVIAESFARGVQRSAVNNAFPLTLACPGITKKVKRWDEVELNLKTGLVKNLTTGDFLQGPPLADDWAEIIEDGGLLANLEKRLKGTVTEPGRVIHF